MMCEMPTDYTLSDLVKLTGVSPRTVRYYIAQGLLPAPTQSGPAARYSDAHLGRLRLIRKLQAGHLPLAEIRRQLDALPEEEMVAAANGVPPAAQVADSALDYIGTLLRRAPDGQLPSIPTPPPAPAPSAAPSSAPSTAPSTAPPTRVPARAHWERISLDPDVELHIRRPLTRQQNKRVERLISIARQLLEED